MSDTVFIEIKKELYDKAITKTDDVTDFVEKQLLILINDDFSDEFDIIVELSKKVDEIKDLERRLTRIRKNRMKKVLDVSIFDESMLVITRIHENLGMIGKNQIKSIAKRNNVPYDALLEFVEKNGYNVVNYTGVKK